MASAHLSTGKAVRKQGGTREDNALHQTLKSTERKDEERDLCEHLCLFYCESLGN